ncbi:hypothetical protein PHAVU_008G120900 [Phaseolus vulgaris]|uniref:RRM domain-containing protein n=1 Tax=Phaseolus vulgaris TaxID=3885 RepID=V7B3X3_PHAVU|nr:hypothetical protein PHAVU_008G120900g [Phaseolus vulgaris]ESW12529.1 hypothetical protein PHAVU_008G120900g [Phaseolus vulgaris]
MADTSFFFTNFPEHFMERDLLKVFQRWGRVMDVFVSRKLNARNRKFGFVRELSAIWIGTWKMQVNLPKYQRKDGSRKKKNEGSRLGRNPMTSTTSGKGKQMEQVSFAQVVSGGSRKAWDRRDLEVEQDDWLEGCYVGSLKELPSMQVIKESFVLGGFNLVKVRYLGGRFVLLSCDDGGSLKKIIADNRSWFDEAFSAVTPWDGSFELKEHFAWIRCSGIPLQFWCKHSFSKIGAVVGEVMEVDKATERRETVEFARFRVKTSVRSAVNMEKELCINGRSCKVAFVEEMANECARYFFERERVELVGGHGSLSCSKIEIVDSYVEVASSKESKSANDKARSNGGVGESRCTLKGNVRAKASFQAPPQEPFQEVGVQEINDGGPASLKVCPPIIRCVENGVLSVKGVVGDLKCQSAFMKPCKENLSVQDGCHEEEEGEVGSVSRQTSSVSRVANSVGICPSLNDLEQSGTSVIRDGVDGSLVATVKDIPKCPVVQGLNDSGPVDPEKLVDAEGARRSEM